jgi:hypothetical protein
MNEHNAPFVRGMKRGIVKQCARPKIVLELTADTSNNSLPDGTQTVLSWDGVLHNDFGSNAYNLTDECLIAPYSGLWHVYCDSWTLCDYYGAIWANDGTGNEFEIHDGTNWNTHAYDGSDRIRSGNYYETLKSPLWVTLSLRAGWKVRALQQYGGWGGGGSRNGHQEKGSTFTMWPVTNGEPLLTYSD